MTTYTISPYTHCLLHDRADWEHFSESDVRKHFENIHALLLDRLSTVGNDLHVVTPDEEKELQFMLEAMLQVKQYVQEFEA